LNVTRIQLYVLVKILPVTKATISDSDSLNSKEDNYRFLIIALLETMDLSSAGRSMLDARNIKR